jgi:ribosome-binding factor A
MADQQRVRRVGELIQRQIAVMLQREIKDPRVKNLIISAVDVNRDLSVAKVYYTFMDADPDYDHTESLAQTQLGLDKAKGYMRHLLGQNIKIRSIPRLHFIYDKSIERGNYMSSLIDQIIENDEQKHQKN